MGKTVGKPGMGEEFFYHTGEDSVWQVQCRVTFRVDPDCLLHAVRRAVSAYPMYGMKPCLNQSGQLVLIPNSEPLRVYQADSGAARLGTEDTDGYMFRVLYQDQSILLNAHHSLGAGRILFSFLHTVLYYYLDACGIPTDPQGMLYTEETADDPSIYDSLMERVKDRKIAPSRNEYIPQNVYEIPGAEATVCYRITWKQNELSEVLRRIGGSMTALIATVIARALRSCYDVGDRHIVTGIPVDLRGQLGSRSQGNFIGNIRVPFTPQMAGLSFDDQVRETDQIFRDQLYLPNILNRVQSLIPLVEAVNRRPLTGEADAAQGKGKGSPSDRGNDSAQSGRKTGLKEQTNNAAALARQTYMLSNIGRLAAPADMCPFITGYDVFSALKNRYSAVVLRYGNTGMLKWMQPSSEERLVRAICDLFEEQGLPVCCQQTKEYETDIVRPSLFDFIQE